MKHYVHKFLRGLTRFEFLVGLFAELLRAEDEMLTLLPGGESSGYIILIQEEILT